jgi:hypothetical protein
MLIIVAMFMSLIDLSQTHSLCLNDNECPYYCGINRKCQTPIPRGHKCSGYEHHARECDISSWCDPDKDSTCQLLKSIEEKCNYDYSCIDNYCDPKTKTCQYRRFINDYCQTNRSCHSNYCEAETETCQSTEELSFLSRFGTVLFLLITSYIIFKKIPKIDVATQTNDAQHAPETELN